MSPWINIVDKQPAQGQRILCRLKSPHGVWTATTSYDKYSFEHWSIIEWVPIPKREENEPCR